MTNTAVVNGDDAAVDFSAETNRGTLERQAHLVKEEGDWKWCGAGPVPEEKGFRVQVP